MFVLSSPSGAGKTTLSRSLISEEKDVVLSISATTRARRPSEAEGVHYHFLTRRDFERRRDEGDLLEWAEVHGNLYGTLREPVEAVLARGRDVLFDIDWQGTAQIREKMPEDLISVFILPPTAAELHARLRRRAEDSEDVIAKRLSNGREEIRHWPEYDHILVNRDFDTTLMALRSILSSERTKRFRQEASVRTFTDQLISGLDDQIDDLSAS